MFQISAKGLILWVWTNLASKFNMGFVYLAIAIIFEVTATITLKATDSFTRLWPSIVVIVCVFTSLYFFSICLRTVNVAVAYPIWSGVGATLVTILAWQIYGQKMDGPALAGIALIVAGVAVINVYSKTVSVPTDMLAVESIEHSGNELLKER